MYMHLIGFGALSSEESVITQYTMQAGNGDFDYMSRDWTLQVSNDNSIYTTIDTKTSQTFTAAEVKTYSIATTQKWRYWKFDITANGNGLPLYVNEIGMLTAGSVNQIPTMTSNTTSGVTITGTPSGAAGNNDWMVGDKQIDNLHRWQGGASGTGVLVIDFGLAI